MRDLTQKKRSFNFLKKLGFLPRASRDSIFKLTSKANLKFDAHMCKRFDFELSLD